MTPEEFLAHEVALGVDKIDYNPADYLETIASGPVD